MQAQVDLKQRVKDSFYRMVTGQQTLEAAQNTLDLVGESYAIAEKRFAAGAGPQLNKLPP